MKLSSFQLFPAFKIEQNCKRFSKDFYKDKSYMIRSVHSNSFANIYLSWNPSAMFCSIETEDNLSCVIELYISTRKRVVLDQYCHCFCIIPKREKTEFKEITRFEATQVRHLTKENQINISTEGKKRFITVSLNSLFGFDPTKYPYIYFSYRIDRAKGDTQFYSNDYRLKNPALWEKINLI